MSAVAGVPNQRQELLDLILDLSFERRPVTLSSGKTSTYYVDCKKVTLHPRGLFLATQLLFNQLNQSTYPEAVGGPTLGADPLTAGLILFSHNAGKPLAGFIVRKEPKKHGTQAWIEGAENIRPGSSVAMIEDVTTTGASCLQAIEKVVEAGFVVTRVLSLLDREEGGRDNLLRQGYKLEALFTAQDLLRRDKERQSPL